MFRVDDDLVVDATVKGNAARYHIRINILRFVSFPPQIFLGLLGEI